VLQLGSVPCGDAWKGERSFVVTEVESNQHELAAYSNSDSSERFEESLAN